MEPRDAWGCSMGSVHLGLTLVLLQSFAGWCLPTWSAPCGAAQILLTLRRGVEQGWWGLPHMELSHGTHLAAPHRFITRKGREICANPEHDWVKKYVTELELN